MSNINANNIIDVNESELLVNTPMMVIEQEGKTIAVPIMVSSGSGSDTPASITVDGNIVTISTGTIAEQQEIAVGTALAAHSYTPGSDPIVIQEGQYLTGDQTISGDANFKAENIKDEVTIWGVKGTYKGESSGGEGGIDVYKCTSVDTGMAYNDYTDVSITGVTPSAMNTEYAQNDPMLVDFNRTWTANGNSVGWDKANSAWCIYEGDGTPDYVSSLFYSKIEGMSAENGTSSDPIFWDSDSSGNRMLTVDFISGDAPYDDYSGESSWSVYAKLKGGTEYTIGIAVPPNNDETGYYYEAYFYVYDDKNTQVANTSSRAEAVNIGGKDVTWYCKYTPTADGLFRFTFSAGWGPGFTTPFACSPAPEVTTAPKTGLFEQDGNWQIGGGQNASVRVLSAGLPQCVGDFTQIAGNGVGVDSVWQNADGSVFIYAYQYYGEEYQWYMGPESGASSGAYYYSNVWTVGNPVHPGVIKWSTRASSSYGDLPVSTVLPTTAVSGTPVLTPVEKAGRDELGYSIWSGVKMEQVGGVWQETEEVRDGMQSAAFTPAPGDIYSEDGSVRIQNAYKGGTSVLAWGGNNSTYGTLGIGTTVAQYTPVKHDRVYKQIACYGTHALAIDDNGHLWGWGYNEYRQLGDGTTTNRHSPVQIGNKVWKQIAVGENHSVGLDTDGYLYVWGRNQSGELGNGSATGSYLNEPTKISDKKFTYIHAYYRCTFAIDEEGYMWGSGRNASGELGNGTKADITTLTKLNDKKWKSVWSASTNRTYAIDADGYLYGTGWNGYGQLGIGSSTQVYEWTKCGDLRWKKVAGGHGHTIAISEEGFLYACGKGYGAAGFGNNILTKMPDIGRVKDCVATYDGNFCIDEYGRVFTFTGSSSGCMFAMPLNGVQTVSPVRILQEYSVDKLYCTIDGTARFAIVKE